MIDTLKKMAMEKGMALMQSETVTKVLSNEQVASMVEGAMTIPFKISNAITSQKEKLVSLLDLATQEDIDEIRRSMSRVEGALNNLNQPAGSDDNASDR